ncbi:MAG TPA: hypothetical protein VFI27_21255 [candidate division Zixibacteria bacterium]|nr:hypothetical protein [candidate division Zixibacteria bacterium]
MIEQPINPIDQDYEVDLLGSIQQALAGLQGFDVMALELIQNADDAGAEELIFDVRDDKLFVQNDGQFSSCGLIAKRCPWEETGGPDGLRRPCNFHAIRMMASRNKIQASGQIGRFGIGFVSVFQVTDVPIIRSNGIEMRLNPIDGKAPTLKHADGGGTEFELPWASANSPTRRSLNASQTPPEIVPLMVENIIDAMERGLYFLRCLRRVELRRNGVPEKSVTVRREDGVLTFEVKPESRIEHWKILTRDCGDLAGEHEIFDKFPILRDLDRTTAVQVAIPLFEHQIEGLLYAYLPTEQPSGMPVHINGDFFPHPDRRSIVC